MTIINLFNIFENNNLENKNDMSFLHETLDLSNDDIHRALSNNMEQSKPSPNHQHPQQPPHHGPQQQRQHLHSMDYVSVESSHSQSHSSFDVNLDAFDILSDFPELSQYEGNNGLINTGQPSPMLSQVEMGE